jgi:hypothetical protein
VEGACGQLRVQATKMGRPPDSQNNPPPVDSRSRLKLCGKGAHLEPGQYFGGSRYSSPAAARVRHHRRLPEWPPAHHPAKVFPQSQHLAVDNAIKPLIQPRTKKTLPVQGIEGDNARDFKKKHFNKYRQTY